MFGCKSKHGGDEFDILVNEENEVLLCLHKWGAHDHPTLEKPLNFKGNGLILYFRTKSLERCMQKAVGLGAQIESEIQGNSNSMKREFSLRDPDGYYITITEFHNYEG